jgi:hypothetical protein
MYVIPPMGGEDVRRFMLELLNIVFVVENLEQAK